MDSNKTFHDFLNEPEFKKSLYNSGMFYVDYAQGSGLQSKLCNSLGYSFKDMSSREYQKRIHKDDLDMYLRLWNRFNTGQDDELYCEYRLIDKKGNWNWIQTHATVLSRDKEGSIKKIIGFDKNINKRKKAEELIHNELVEERKKNAVSKIVFSAGKNVVENLELSENLFTGLNKMKSILDFHYCAIYICGKEENNVIYYPDADTFNFPDTDELLKQVKTLKYPIIDENRINHTGSVMAVPLLSNSEIIGAIVLFHKQAGSFNGNDLYPVMNFADILSVALINSLTLKRIIKDMEKDHLTGILTRKSFEKAVKEIWKKVRSGDENFFICMMDIDHFKKINDSYGHQTGDKVIQKISAICKGMLRDIDILGRYGGDEFIIAITDNMMNDVEKIMERIWDTIEASVFPDITEGVTVSTGISYYKDGDSMESLISRADKALYFAKKSGRNRVAAG